LAKFEALMDGLLVPVTYTISFKPSVLHCILYILNPGNFVPIFNSFPALRTSGFYAGFYSRLQ